MDNKQLIPPGLTYLADNIVTKDNLLGAAKASGASWAKDLDLPKNMETIFFAGCGYQYSQAMESLTSLARRLDKSAIGTESTMSLVSGFQKKLGIDTVGIYRKLVAGNPEAEAKPLRDAVKVLRKIGIKFGYLGNEEPCCGGLLHYIGLEKEFTKHAQGVSDKLESAGVKQLIGIIPSCTYTLRNLIPASTGRKGVTVKHFSEVVAEHLPSLQLRFPREVKVTYHDPCQMARFLKLIDEPRQILKAIKGVTFIETDWTNRQYTTCCGGGSGFEAVFPELSEMLAVNRARELVATGAEIIITHCPGCLIQLKAGVKGLKASGVEVLDLAEVVAMSMEG